MRTEIPLKKTTGAVRAVLAGVALAAQLALAQPVAGAAPAAGATLAEAVEAAWQRSAQSAQAAGQARQAQAAHTAAAARWAAPPALEASYLGNRQRGTATVRETELGVAVPLWLPGQRVARLGAAQVQGEVAAAARAAARLRVAAQVREAWWEIAL